MSTSLKIHIEYCRPTRSRVQSILRKESSPSPPKENGLQHKKVMFDVSRDTEMEVEVHCTSEITRTHSEEEFEYLEKSLIEHSEFCVAMVTACVALVLLIV